MPLRQWTVLLHANKSTLGNSVEMIGLQLETEKLMLNEIKLSMTHLKVFYVLGQYKLQVA